MSSRRRRRAPSAIGGHLDVPVRPGASDAERLEAVEREVRSWEGVRWDRGPGPKRPYAPELTEAARAALRDPVSLLSFPPARAVAVLQRDQAEGSARASLFDARTLVDAPEGSVFRRHPSRPDLRVDPEGRSIEAAEVERAYARAAAIPAERLARPSRAGEVEPGDEDRDVWVPGGGARPFSLAARRGAGGATLLRIPPGAIDGDPEGFARRVRVSPGGRWVATFGDRGFVLVDAAAGPPVARVVRFPRGGDDGGEEEGPRRFYNAVSGAGGPVVLDDGTVSMIATGAARVGYRIGIAPDGRLDIEVALLAPYGFAAWNAPGGGPAPPAPAWIWEEAATIPTRRTDGGEIEPAGASFLHVATSRRGLHAFDPDRAIVDARSGARVETALPGDLETDSTDDTDWTPNEEGTAFLVTERDGRSWAVDAATGDARPVALSRRLSLGGTLRAAAADGWLVRPDGAAGAPVLHVTRAGDARPFRPAQGAALDGGARVHEVGGGAVLLGDVLYRADPGRCGEGRRYPFCPRDPFSLHLAAEGVDRACVLTRGPRGPELAIAGASQVLGWFERGGGPLELAMRPV